MTTRWSSCVSIRTRYFSDYAAGCLDGSPRTLGRTNAFQSQLTRQITGLNHLCRQGRQGDNTGLFEHEQIDITYWQILKLR